MKGEKLLNKAFHPCFIYNRYFHACHRETHLLHLFTEGLECLIGQFFNFRQVQLRIVEAGGLDFFIIGNASETAYFHRVYSFALAFIASRTRLVSSISFRDALGRVPVTMSFRVALV